MFSYNKVSLSINTIPGKIDMNISEPERKNTIEEPQLNVNRKQDKLEISSKPGKIEIDAKQAWADRGSKDYRQFAKENASKGHRVALQTIKKIAKNGDQLMNNIEPKAKTLINQMKNEFNQNSNKEIRLGFASAPKMSGEPGKLKIKMPKDEVTVDLRHGTVTGDLKWGQVNAYLVQRPDVQVQVQGNLLDISG